MVLVSNTGFCLSKWKLFCSPMPENYQNVLALVFAVKEINENPKILPNITLGVRIYDSYLNSKGTYEASMRVISPRNRLLPNYKCNFKDNIITIIEGLISEDSYKITEFLATYKFPQVG